MIEAIKEQYVSQYVYRRRSQGVIAAYDRDEG